MSRCETHCPQPSGFPWLALLLIAAAALALWGIGELVQAVGKAGLVIGATAGLLLVGGGVVLFIADAVTSTPKRERRPRYSELPTTVDQPAPAEPAVYPPLRAVPDLDEERAA